jgi:hypothetical protein
MRMLVQNGTMTSTNSSVRWRRTRVASQYANGYPRSRHPAVPVSASTNVFRYTPR